MTKYLRSRQMARLCRLRARASPPVPLAAHLPALLIPGRSLTLLHSPADERTWRTNLGSPVGPGPSSYPCLAYSWLDSERNNHAAFLYPADVQAMAQVLEATPSTAEGSTAPS